MACCWFYANNKYILLVLQPNLGWEICHSLVRSHFRVPNTRRPSTGALGGIVSRTQGVKIKPLWSYQQLSQQAISIRLPAFSKAHFQWEMNTHPPPELHLWSVQTDMFTSIFQSKTSLWSYEFILYLYKKGDPLADFNLWSGRPMISLCSDVFLPAPLTQDFWRWVSSAVFTIWYTCILLWYTAPEIVPTLKTHHGLGFQTFNLINYARALPPDQPCVYIIILSIQTWGQNFNLVSNLRRPSSRAWWGDMGSPKPPPTLVFELGL